MEKLLHIRQLHNDYQVKNPKTFAKEHCKEIKKLKQTDVQLDGEDYPLFRKVKVKQITNTIFEWSDEYDKWMFSCDVVVNVIE